MEKQLKKIAEHQDNLIEFITSSEHCEYFHVLNSREHETELNEIISNLQKQAEIHSRIKYERHLITTRNLKEEASLVHTKWIFKKEIKTRSKLVLVLEHHYPTIHFPNHPEGFLLGGWIHEQGEKQTHLNFRHFPEIIDTAKIKRAIKKRLKKTN